MSQKKQNNKRFKKTVIATAISTALMYNSIGFTQETKEESAKNNNAVEEIIVTANRREQSVQDIPYNVSAVSGDFLVEAQITDSTELMRSIPGVAVVDRGARNSGVINGINIRGLNVDGSALGDYQLSTVPTVSTYVNETPIYANFILKDVNRVEVLRGPQGTLYGSGSLGGTVKYILNEPKIGEFEGRVNLALSSTEGGNELSWDSDVMLNFPVGDKMAIRFVGGKMDYAGITDYVNVYALDQNRVPLAPDGLLADTSVVNSVKNADTVNIKHARVSVLLEPTDNFSALLSYQTQSDDIGGRRQVTKGLNGFGEAYGDYENGSVILEPSSREVDLTSLEMELDLGFATLTSSSSDYDHTGESISENTGFYAQNGWLAAFYYNYPRPLAEAVRTYKDSAFVQELRLVSNGNNTIDYTVGLFYQNQDLQGTQESYLRGFQAWADSAFGPGVVADDNDFSYLRDQNFKDRSFFGELTYHLNDDLAVTVGARRYNTDFTNDTLMNVGLYTSFDITDTANFKESELGTLFKANIAYDLNEDTLLYGTISEGYRRGGANAVPLSGIFAESAAWQKFKSDTNTNFEIGIKGSNSDNTVSYNVSLFYVDWQDIQINTATTNWGFFAAQNGGSAKTSGIEAELHGYMGDENQWQYDIGYSYVSAELTEDVFAPSDPDHTSAVAFDGTVLPGTPKNTFNLALSHGQDLSNDVYWFNRFSIYYQSETENAINTSPRFAQTLDGFAILDYMSSFSYKDWTATLWMKNISNEEGTTGVFKEQYMGTSPAQNYFGNGSKQFITLPRTVGLTLSYDF